MKLLSQFRRVNDELGFPDQIGEGGTVGSGGVWGWVRIPDRSTDEHGQTRLVFETQVAALDLRKLIPPGADYHFKIQWGEHSGAEYLAEETDPGMSEGAKAWFQLDADRIDENRFSKRQVLLGVRFDDDAPDRVGTFGRAKKLMGTADPSGAQKATLAQVLVRIHSWQGRMRQSSFKAEPASVAALAWSLRRDLRRTVGWIPDTMAASGGQMVRLTAADVRPKTDHLEIDTDDGDRLISMITTSQSGFPVDGLSLPGGEWLKHLNIARVDDEDDAPAVDVSIRGRNVPRVEALKRLESALALAKDQQRGAAGGMAQDAPQHILDARRALATRIEEVRSGNVGMVTDSVTWIVEATDPVLLARRQQALIDYYGGMGVTCCVTPYVQDLLYKETVLGDKRRIADFEQFSPWDTLAGAWFHGGSMCGEPTGPYVAGNVGSTPGPFRNRLSNAQLDGDPVTSVFTGASGSGKSTAVMLSLCPEAILGAWTLLTDFKGDQEGICDLLRGFGVRVAEVSTADAASGSLCPWRYVPDPDEAASRAVDNLMMLSSVKADPEQEDALREAAAAVAARPNPWDRSTAAVIELLTKSTDPKTSALGRRLLNLASDALARPVAGFPDRSVLPLSAAPGLTYMKFDQLRWPDASLPREEWQPGERLSMMLVRAGIAYAMFMATRVKGIPKVLALTELHYLTRYAFGKQVIGDVAKTGRALDINVLLDTQAGARLLEVPDLADQISFVNAFRVRTTAEAVVQAQLLGIEPEAAFIEGQKSLAQGDCLIRDRRGNVAPIHYDLKNTEIAAALDTKPKRTFDGVPGDDDLGGVDLVGADSELASA